MSSTTAATTLSTLFQMQTSFLQKAVLGISKEHAIARVNDSNNHIAWLTGHIISCRYMLGRMLGLEVSEPFPKIFGNLRGLDENIEYPSLDELMESLPIISSQLAEKLDSMSDGDMEKEAFGGKLIDIVEFLVYHEAYHIGQIGFLRKFWGYEALQHN